MTSEKKSQIDKFKEAARDLGCDDDEARFAERVGKLVKPMTDAEKAAYREKRERHADELVKGIVENLNRHTRDK